ncbi:MAG: DNA alkylation repair protein [Lachnospiraceae bacterium]|nr:DNA alkylation repair protein [Lachnospiraceae bacterium]
MEKFTKESYDEFLAMLDENADKGYMEFHKKLVPGVGEVRGVRSPVVKGFAKNIAKGDYDGFIKMVKFDSYEETITCGLVIGYCKADIDTKLEYLKDFIPYINNWAVCDSTVSAFKIKKQDEKTVYKFLQPYLQSDKEFDIRFGVVMLMSSFISDEYIDDILRIYGSIESDKYYVQMGVAWGISVCFVKYPEKTMELFKDNSLDDFTYNKALQKIIESLRVDKETKDIIRSMKRKK